MDRVKLYPQERLDLDDVRALQALGYDYSQEELGAVLGPARGVLSVPRVTVTENSGAPYMTLSPFAFVTSTPVADRGASVSGGVTEYAQHKSVVANYDGAEQSSAQVSLDVARAYYQDSAGSWYLWARPALVDTNTATRRKWDVGSGAETSFSDETRESQRVAFAIQGSEPTYAAGEARWAPLALLVSWSNEDNPGSVPTWRWSSAWDDDAFVTWANTFKGVSGTTSTNISLRRLTENAGTEPLSGLTRLESLGLRAQLAYLRYVLANIQGPGVNWDQVPPTASLAQANTRLNALEAQQLSLVQCLASCRVGVTVSNATLQTFAATRLPGSYGISTSSPAVFANVASGLQTNRVNIVLDNAILSQEWAITHVSVTQIVQKKSLTEPGHSDYNRVTLHVDPRAYSDDSSDTSTMRTDEDSATRRGLVVEFLPQLVPAVSHGGVSDSEHEIHAPDGSAAATRTLNDITPSSSATYDLMFSVAVFGVPSLYATM